MVQKAVYLSVVLEKVKVVKDIFGNMKVLNKHNNK